MSRRPPPNPSAERAAQNQQTLKALVKVESNKNCADCKRSKHPRWASWNLGIFICIRCSGIHRGMGTHISRVKSVDLDAWTDEQMQNMLRWGNARANKYWEAKLAAGHVPADAKIENFIRTKYDSKRWVMDGPMPDPSTLEVGGDDDVPLNVVQEKAKLDRSGSTRSTISQAPPPPPPAKNTQPIVDLFGDDPVESPAPRPSSAAPAPTPSAPPPQRSATTASKPSRAGDSLLGFDFFNSASSSAPPRPSSTSSAATGAAAPSRPDLKQSILSLYASAPRPQANEQQHQRSDSSSQQSRGTSQGVSGLGDAFSSLNFSSTSSQSPPTAPKASPFANLASPTSATRSTAPSSSGFGGMTGGSGGSFFESKPIKTSPPAGNLLESPGKSTNAFNGFGDFTTAEKPALSRSKPSNSGNDLGSLDFSMSSPPISTSTQTPAVGTSAPLSSPFNLSAPKHTSTASISSQSSINHPPQPAPQTSPPAHSSALNMDPWGSGDAWASSNNAAVSKSPTFKSPATASLASPGFGDWGSNDGGGFSMAPPTSGPPKVTADEDFGGWETNRAAPSTSTTPAAPLPKPSGGFGGNEDLFSNVWE